MKFFVLFCSFFLYSNLDEQVIRITLLAIHMLLNIKNCSKLLKYEC